MKGKTDILTSYIALSQGKGIRASIVRELVTRLGNVGEFFNLKRNELERLTGSSSDLFADDVRADLYRKAEEERIFVESSGISALALDGDGYPQRLAECVDAPVMLYRLGADCLDAAHIVGIVGTRHATAYGVDFTTRLVENLAKKLDNVVIVSGLAYGIDIAAHKAALAAGVPTVGVVAHGLNTIYPADHRSVAAKMVKNGGAIVTEYGKDTAIFKGNFLARNRIVAGLCDCVVVVESGYKGGALSTARIAGEYNREVFAVPGRLTDKYSIGTNGLIARNAATLLSDADALIDHIGWTPREVDTDEPPTLFPALSPEERAILEIIREKPNATANDICVAAGLPYNIVADRLFKFEMDELVMIRPGGHYELTPKSPV